MATLAAYFGLGKQKHRYKFWSKPEPCVLDIFLWYYMKPVIMVLQTALNRSLDDVRMNLEVLKHCATVLFLVISNIFIIPSDFITHFIIIYARYMIVLKS